MVLWLSTYFLVTFFNHMAGWPFTPFKVRYNHAVYFGQLNVSKRDVCPMFLGVLRAIAQYTFPTLCSSHQSGSPITLDP